MAGGSVSHREQVSVHGPGGWEWSNQVNMYVGEATAWYWNGGWLELDMPVDLVRLAEQASPSH